MSADTTTAIIERYDYTITDTPVGLALIAAGSCGIATILLGDDPARLVRQARAVLPGGSELIEGEGVRDAAAAVAAWVAAPSTDFSYPLDLRGSPVELAVWYALRAIPLGETVTYGAIAKALDVPATAQEVGAACAANRIAIAVPCHRVVKADGSVSGYRWGVHRKRQLINLEAAA